MYQGSHLSKNRFVLRHLLSSKHRSLVTTSFLACKVVRSYAIPDTPPTHLQSSALKTNFHKVEKSLTIICFSVFRWIKQIRQPSRFWQSLKKNFEVHVFAENIFVPSGRFGHSQSFPA